MYVYEYIYICIYMYIKKLHGLINYFYTKPLIFGFIYKQQIFRTFDYILTRTYRVIHGFILVSAVLDLVTLPPPPPPPPVKNRGTDTKIVNNFGIWSEQVDTKFRCSFFHSFFS
jgi:hypothetical protein